MTKRVVSEKSKKNLVRFKKGKSGNPKGKKKGTKDFKTILKEIMAVELETTDPFTKKKCKISNRKSMMINLFSLAMKKTNTLKDLRAIEAIMDRMEGKPVQQTNIGGIDGNPIEVETKNINLKMTEEEAARIYMEKLK